MIVTIVGSRRRNRLEDRLCLMDKLQELHKQDPIIKIITGDCKSGGDSFAREIANAEHGEVELDVKIVILPPKGANYWEIVKAYYKRDEEIAKEETDFFIALVSEDRTGGTEKTIQYFKRYHKDWEKKLIIL